MDNNDISIGCTIQQTVPELRAPPRRWLLRSDVKSRISLDAALFHSRQFNVNAQPYVTFVSYFRNDNYTNDFVLRVKRATHFLVAQLQRAELDSEVILVEWNPPVDRPLIIESLDALPQGGHVSVRTVVVRNEHHQTFLGAQEWGMNPAAAANVGLRRAQGRFVSPKAADTYLSDEIVATIARRDLHENALYRCDRCDVALSARDLANLGRPLAARPSREPGQHAAQPDAAPAPMVHTRPAYERLRRLFADEPEDVAHRPRLPARRHGAVVRLRFADHACGGGPWVA